MTDHIQMSIILAFSSLLYHIPSQNSNKELKQMNLATLYFSETTYSLL